MQRAHLQRGCTRPQQATNSRPLRGLSALGISGNERYAYPRRLAVGSRPALAGELQGGVGAAGALGVDPPLRSTASLLA